MSQNARWLLFLPETSSMEDVFRETNIPVDCEFLVAQHRGRVVKLSEVYRIHATFPLEIHGVGNWSLADGLHWTRGHILQRRGNLRGLLLAATFASVRQAVPFYHITKWYSNCVSAGPASYFQGFLNHISLTIKISKHNFDYLIWSLFSSPVLDNNRRWDYF